MYYNKIKLLIALGLLGFLITSCSEDETETTEDLIGQQANARGQGNNGNDGRGNDGRGNDGRDNNGPGNNDNDGQVGALDNDILEDWMELFLELDQYATGMRPNATARAIAYINLAAYETAIPGMDNYNSNSGQIPGFEFSETPNTEEINFELALNACYADVMAHFMTNVTNGVSGGIATLEAETESELSADLTSTSIDASKAWGAQVAEAIIAYAQTDSEAEAQITSPQPTSYVPPTGDGFWTYSAEPERALFPYWESVRTFVISPNETTTIPPIEYSDDADSEYYAQMEEVRVANDEARAEEGEELWIAEFWSDDVEELMISPPGRQISIANQLIDQHNLDLDEALHMYLKIGFALNDAAVTAWKYKYQYMVMRPSVFIHEYMDPNFQTNLFRLIPWPNPSFPGYPSGHSTFASAAGGIFIGEFGDRTNFTDRTHEGRTEFKGEPRRFRSFTQMAEENAYSRIPLGVHVRMDCDEGIRLGWEISDAVNNFNLTRQGA